MWVRLFILLLIAVCFGLNAADRRIALLVQPDCKGEFSFANRIKYACKNINWEADVIDIRNANDLNNKYNFVINLIPGNYEHPSCKNYMAIFHPTHHYFHENGLLKKDYRSYEGYLLSYSPHSLEKDQNDFIKKDEDDGFVNTEGLFPYMRWHPTVQKTNFQVVDPSSLFYICCTWGDRFEDVKFQQCLSLLDKEINSRFYGDPLFYSLYPKSYQGELPYDCNSLYDAEAQAGIVLVLHSSDHNVYGLPSGRIFEAAAASTVIICDQNSFVKKHFGDSVLYINTEGNGVSIYKQIRSHLNWIKLNKTAALEKAKKAHDIFMQNFLLEDQLLRLGRFHDALSNQTKS